MKVRFRRWLAGELGVVFWQIPLAEIAVRRFMIGYAFQPPAAMATFWPSPISQVQGVAQAPGDQKSPKRFFLAGFRLDLRACWMAASASGAMIL